MEIDTDKIDEAALALLFLTLHDERRAWKGFDFEVMSRLHQQGYIDDPVNKNKSVCLRDEPRIRSWAWHYREISLCQARHRSQVMALVLAKSDNDVLAH